MFATVGWVYVNAMPPPDRTSTATLGQRSYLVIARLVLPDQSEEWRPARTLRFTATHVLVVVEPDGEPVYIWLSPEDIRRTIHMPVTATAVHEAMDDATAHLYGTPHDAS